MYLINLNKSLVINNKFDSIDKIFDIPIDESCPKINPIPYMRVCGKIINPAPSTFSNPRFMNASYKVPTRRR